jgi:predicted phosphate transport protein (TIGR00153 family)
MPLRLIPQERRFFELLRRDIAACQQGVLALNAMLGEYRDLKAKAARIHEIEHEGDRITAELFMLLNRTFVTPLEREDLIALSGIIDNVLDKIDEVAAMLVLYGVAHPTPYLRQAGEVLAQAVEALVKAIDCLERLRDMQPFLSEVHQVENEADGLYHNAIAELFLPDTYPPLEVIKWKSIYDCMEEAFDTCEDVANVLANVALKNG